MEDYVNDIRGKWTNITTGQEIFVKNNIIDGDQMILITNIGTMSLDEFSKHYIKCSDEIYDEQGNVIGKEEMTVQPIQQSKPSDIKPQFDQEYDFDDTVYSTIKLNNTQTEKTQTQQLPETKKNSQINNIDLIDKIFKKIDSKPEINIDLSWENFPNEQILTLINYLDVDIDDIANYIYCNFLNVDNLKNMIKTIIKNKLNI